MDARNLTPDEEEREALEEALDIFVYAPIGFALEFRRLFPELVERGRRQVNFARSVGKLASSGVGMKNARAKTVRTKAGEAASSGARRSAETSSAAAPASPQPPPPPTVGTRRAAKKSARINTDRKTTTGSAKKVAPKAPMASKPKKAATNKKAVPKKAVPKKAVPKKAVPKKAVPKKAVPKKAVPKKAVPKKAVTKKAVAKTASGAGLAPSLEPRTIFQVFPGYDNATAREILRSLDDLDAPSRVVVLAYEKSHRNRVTIVNRLTQLGNG